MNLTNIFELRQEYLFAGKMSILEEKLLALEWPIMEKRADNIYKIRPVFSFGTILNSSCRGFEGINVVVTFVETDDGIKKVVFTSKLRKEIYLIFVIFILSSYKVIKEGKLISTFPIILVLCSLAFVWFQWIFRKQEKALIKEVVEKLCLISQ